MSFEQAESDYSELTQAMLDYGYTEDWTKLRTADLSIKELQQVAEKVGYHVNINADGSIRNITKDVTAPIKSGYITGSILGGESLGSSINSNLEIGTTAPSNNTVFESVADVTADVAEGATAAEAASAAVKASKLTKFADGVKGVLNTPVVGHVLPLLIAASDGIKLGKGIDSAIYDLGKAMDLNPPESLNPETWSSLTEDLSDEGLEGKFKWAFNTIFDIDDKGNTTMYADENAFAYMAWYLQQLGWLQNSEYSVQSNPDNIKVPSDLKIPFNFVTGQTWTFPHQSWGPITIGADSQVFAVGLGSTEGAIDTVLMASSKSFKGGSGVLGKSPSLINSTKSTINGKTVYWLIVGIPRYNELDTSVFPWVYTSNLSSTSLGEIAYLMVYNYTESSGAPDGITTLDGATVPDLGDISSESEALQKLKELYPELWDNRVENTVIQPDGSEKTYTYVPLPFPQSGTEEKVDTKDATQTQTKVNPQPDTKTDPEQKPATESQLWSLIQIITNSLNKPQGMTETQPDPQKQPQANPDATPLNPDPPTNPPDTGTGEPPAVVPPTGSASSLWAIYNPTIPQINDFGAWLWSPNFVDQILKLFNDPMQSIIGLHRVYATPVTGETRTIKVGYLDSGVSSLIVTDQYSTVDCGTVNLREYFGNVLDYDPYTQVQLYLPFIGIVNLDVADVMRSSINIVYHVDVLTGACLAEVKVIRDAAGGTLYQYAGNAAVTMPISSGSYMGIVASIASIAGGVAGTIASGGAMAPMLLGSASSALGSARTKVEHSGGFSGNAGAMGIKKPYLIISRPQAALAKNYQNYIGDPSNTTTTLGSCSGYVQVKECHLENIPATQQELNNIEQILKGGVLI